MFDCYGHLSLSETGPILYLRVSEDSRIKRTPLSCDVGAVFVDCPTARRATKTYFTIHLVSSRAPALRPTTIHISHNHRDRPVLLIKRDVLARLHF